MEKNMEKKIMGKNIYEKKGKTEFWGKQIMEKKIVLGNGEKVVFAFFSENGYRQVNKDIQEKKLFLAVVGG